MGETREVYVRPRDTTPINILKSQLLLFQFHASEDSSKGKISCLNKQQEHFNATGAGRSAASEAQNRNET